MITVEGDVYIARAVGTVFEFLSRIENYPLWQPGIRGARQTSEGPVAVGTTLWIAFAGPGDRPMEATARVTGYVPGKLFSFQTTSGPASVRGVYGFEAAGDGSVVVVRTDIQPTGALRFLEGLLAGQVKKEFPRSLERLKRVIESRPAAAEPPAPR